VEANSCPILAVHFDVEIYLMQYPAFHPKLLALLAAVLFGASAPLSKLLLGDIAPVLLAALLYLGCGFGLLLLRGLQQVTSDHAAKEAGLTRRDVPWLLGAILAGGVAAPVALMIGLKITPAATASLLLNFEAAATTVIAAVAFKEALGRRIWLAVALITAASIILTWDTSGAWGFSPGAAGVILACVLWGIDNNLTRNISAKDPLSIVMIKGMVAGTVSLVIALSIGTGFPSPEVVGAALALGFFSYGTSIVLFILAMRSLGAARTSAFFGSAPFVGVLISLLLFREWPGVTFALALPLMIAGAVLIVGERHVHLHRHERFEHEHRHVHDDAHHAHTHDGEEGEEHTHCHTHEEVEHAHPHTPDIHHRHAH
jgi:drug/metabolite transporter (DMT)-like permease